MKVSNHSNIRQLYQLLIVYMYMYQLGVTSRNDTRSVRCCFDRGGCVGLLFSWWLDCCRTFRAHRTQSSTALCLIISVGACATRCKGIVGVAAVVVAAYLRVSGMTGRSTCACNACKAPTWLAARRRATRQTQPHIRRSLPAPINRQRSSVRCQYIINITLRRFGLL